LLYPTELRDRPILIPRLGAGLKRIVMHRISGLFACILFASCGTPSSFPDMEPGEHGRVVRVIDGDALVLNTGQSVRLIGIEAPALRPRGREPDSYAVEASRALEDMVMGREVQLFYPGLTRDRYNRALAHVVTTDAAGQKLWLNMALIEQGAARVRLYPDTAARGAELLEAEKNARDRNTGLWGKLAYKIQPAERVPEDKRGFALITATLGQASPPTGELAENLACQISLDRSNLRLEARHDAESICDLPTGTELLLRGWISNGRIDLTHPLHAQPLENAD
jgi:micrococcal nuclease